MTLKSIELIGLLGKLERMQCMEIQNPEDASFYKFCKITKPQLISLKLDAIRFESARDLSLFIDDLNPKVLQSLDLLKIHWTPNDYANLEHLYSIIGRVTALRLLAIPIIEHPSLPSTTFTRLFTKLPLLSTLSFLLRAPGKLASHSSPFLTSLLKDCLLKCHNLSSLTFESPDYLLSTDTLKRILSGGTHYAPLHQTIDRTALKLDSERVIQERKNMVSLVGERMNQVRIEYRQGKVKWEIGERLECRQWIETRCPWVRFEIS